MIEALHLTKRYGSLLAVDDLSFTVAAGQVTVRGGTDLVIVAEMLGHARLERPADEPARAQTTGTRALERLLIDE